MESCKVNEEFNNLNYETSHDGLFKFTVAVDIDQEILDQVGEIRVTVYGSSAIYGYGKQDEYDTMKN